MHSCLANIFKDTRIGVKRFTVQDRTVSEEEARKSRRRPCNGAQHWTTATAATRARATATATCPASGSFPSTHPSFR